MRLMRTLTVSCCAKPELLSSSTRKEKGKRSEVMETIAHLESTRWEHLVERIIGDDLIFCRLME